MYGREPKIPIDIELNLPSRKEEVTPKTYMERLVHKMDWAFRKARENIDKDKTSRKKYHDKTVRCHRVEVGDLVLLRDKKLKSNYKIADKWEEGVYEVISKREKVPVFAIKKLGSKEKTYSPPKHDPSSSFCHSRRRTCGGKGYSFIES